MAFTLTKQADGDLSRGNLRGELVDLQPSISDYATGGYLIEGIGYGTVTAGDVGIDRVLFVIPIGGQGGYVPVWNPTTSKLQIFEQSGAAGPLTEVAANTDLSAYTFSLLVEGL